MAKELRKFAEEDPIGSPTDEKGNWHVLIVDDDEDVHASTRLALKSVCFEQKPVVLHAANCAKDAKKILAVAPDLFALILLPEQTGRGLVKWIRETEKNSKVRIVMRTDEAGRAPEAKFICRYDISDYKQKTELTANKLYTLVHACLGAYKTIHAVSDTKKGLGNVIRSAEKLFNNDTLEHFSLGVMSQLNALLKIRHGGFFARIDGDSNSFSRLDSIMLAATGVFADKSGEHALEEAVSVDSETVLRMLSSSGEFFWGSYFIGVYTSRLNARYVVFFQGLGLMGDTDQQLIRNFGKSMSIAADDHAMHVELDVDQRVALQRLGSFAQEPYQVSNNHNKRIALICCALGQAAGLESDETKLLYRAAPLHDVGKIDVPDEILRKPGKLDPEEWKIMQSHTKIGFDLLLSSEMEVLEAAACVAKSHHENWDGSGYPDGLKGDAIPLFGRIAAIADVFDSLVSARCYRENSWPAEEAFEYLVAQSGNKFDPELIEVAVRIKEQLLNIEARYPDELVSPE